MSTSTSRRNSLTPPARTGTKDPGAHELGAESESDDHFSDAHSAQASGPASPIPKTRIEKVSDEPSYGEVPGTKAYQMREGDAEPDEIAIVADQNKTTGSEADMNESVKSPVSPGGQPIPKTVVEESTGNSEAQSRPEIKHTADAEPDERHGPSGKADAAGDNKDAALPSLPVLNASKSPASHLRKRSSTVTQAMVTANKGEDEEEEEEEDGSEEEKEGFGDDFDDFEEGGGDDDDDFGDFDDGFEQPVIPEPTPVAPSQRLPSIQPLSFPIPDFNNMTSDEIYDTAQPYLNALFPSTSSAYDEQEEDAEHGKNSTRTSRTTYTPSSKEDSIFLTPRSASLWSQLVAPPPLQPPDWIRSRIRRLFLVSLGVPVDLDEILPASKQSKLVLPSLHHGTSARTSTDSARGSGGGGGGGGGGAASGGASGTSKLKQQLSGGANASNTSVDSAGGVKLSSNKKKSARNQPPPEPEFDIVAARQLCKTTDQALDGMTDDELRLHAKRLKVLQITADEVLEHWKKRTDEQIGERTAFEGVIENLVKHARKTRK